MSWKVICPSCKRELKTPLALNPRDGDHDSIPGFADHEGIHYYMGICFYCGAIWFWNSPPIIKVIWKLITGALPMQFVSVLTPKDLASLLECDYPEKQPIPFNRIVPRRVTLGECPIPERLISRLLDRGLISTLHADRLRKAAPDSLERGDVPMTDITSNLP